MINVNLCPNVAVYGKLELRATQLESAVLNTYRPIQEETEKQETMSIWDIMHSYILNVMQQKWNKNQYDHTEFYQKRINALTDREIDILEYKELALNNLPKFSVIEQPFKFKVTSKYFETFMQGTLDAYTFNDSEQVNYNKMYDLKFSWKRWAKQRVIQAKQKIYYTYFTALTFNDWSEKEFNYAIFTTKEKKARLIIENFVLNPRECEAIFLEDFEHWINAKEKPFWDVKTSWFI